MKISFLKRCAHIAGFLLVCPSLAFATTIDWTVDATTYFDPDIDSGGRVTGTFTYDNILQTYSNVSLTYTGGSMLDFTATTVQLDSPTGLLVEGPPMGVDNLKPSIVLNFASGLDLASAGDTIAVCGGGTLLPGSIVQPDDPRTGCGTRHSFAEGIENTTSTNPLIRHFDYTGTISSVPVPAAVWLFGSGLIGLIGVARRKKA